MPIKDLPASWRLRNLKYDNFDDWNFSTGTKTKEILSTFKLALLKIFPSTTILTFQAGGCENSRCLNQRMRGENMKRDVVGGMRPREGGMEFAERSGSVYLRIDGICLVSGKNRFCFCCDVIENYGKLCVRKWTEGICARALFTLLQRWTLNSKDIDYLWVSPQAFVQLSNWFAFLHVSWFLWARSEVKNFMVSGNFEYKKISA